MVLVPQKLIVHYNHCSIKNVGETFIDYINVQLFFLKNVLNCPFVYLVEETHPISNYKGFPYAFNTLEGNILYGEDIVNYMKNLYLFDSVNYETYYGIVSELKAILIYYLWEDDQIYNNFTKKIYRDNFFYLYYIYIIRKLKCENLEKCKTFGLDNHNFNIKRLKEILNILDSVLCGDAQPPKESTVCYFHAICFSILSIFYSIPLKYNNELLDTLMSNPNLINFVKNLNSMYNVWKNEKSFLLGVR